MHESTTESSDYYLAWAKVHIYDIEMGVNPHIDHTNYKWGYITRKENRDVAYVSGVKCTCKHIWIA